MSIATVTPASPATAQPSLPARSTSTSSGAELVAGDPESAAVELLEVARLKRSAHGTELLPELRPEHGQVRLHPQLGVDVPELDLLDAELLGDLVGVRGCERRTLDDDPPQGLAKLQARRRPRLVTERDDAAQLGDLGEQREHPAGVPRASRRGTPSRGAPSTTSVTSACQRCSARNGITGEITRSALDEPEPERAERRLVAVPEAAARAADVPVREIVDVRVEGARHVDREPALVAGLGLRDELRPSARRASGRAAADRRRAPPCSRSA